MVIMYKIKPVNMEHVDGTERMVLAPPLSEELLVVMAARKELIFLIGVVLIV